jgi:hypothetical protein
MARLGRLAVSDDVLTVEELRRSATRLSPPRLVPLVSELAEKYSPNEIAQKTGMSRSHVANVLRVSKKLDPRVYRALVSERKVFPLREWMRLAALSPEEQRAQVFGP